MVSFFFPYMVSHTWLFDLTSAYSFHYSSSFTFSGQHIHNHNCMVSSTCMSWSCILLGAWLRRDIFEESCHSWILSSYHMDYISFESFQLGLWHRTDIMWWVFRYCSLSFNPDFLEPMLCSLGSCFIRGCLLNSSFFLDMHCCHY